jgi:hypothetical protein
LNGSGRGNLEFTRAHSFCPSKQLIGGGFADHLCTSWFA